VTESSDNPAELFRNLVIGKPYDGKAIPLNRLSIGSLSYSVEKEVKRKLGLIEETLKDKITMFRGTALHNHIQSLVKDKGYIAEYRMQYTISHKWKYLGYDTIVLVGVIDLMHNDRKEIIELKSSTSSDRIEDYHKMQLASYMKMMQLLHGERYRGYVIKFGGSDIISEEVSWDMAENYWNQLLQRARECADALDEEMKKQDSDALHFAGRSTGLYSFDASNDK